MPATRKVSGGPLRKRVHRSASPKDVEGFREVFDAFRARAGRPQDRLREDVERSRRELGALGRGINTDPAEVETSLEEAGFAHPDREYYCGQIIWLGSLIEKYIDGDPWFAVGLAIKLGQYSVEMTLGRLDRQAEGLEQRTEKGAARRKQKQASWLPVRRREAAEIWKRHPHYSATHVAKIVTRRGEPVFVDHMLRRGAEGRALPE
jgi:hypothetical protein